MRWLILWWLAYGALITALFIGIASRPYSPEWHCVQEESLLLGKTTLFSWCSLWVTDPIVNNHRS